VNLRVLSILVQMGCNHSGSAVTSFSGVGTPVEEGQRASSRSSGRSEGKSGRGSPVNAEASFHEAFVLGRKLGKGAFGCVYLTRRVESSVEDLAVKVSDLRPPKDKGSTIVDAKRQKAAEKEVAILQIVTGTIHVIRFEAAFYEGIYSYIVMEKCDQTLLQVFERMPNFTEIGLKRVFREMLMGLSAVHAVCIVHRDVKPDNFMCAGADCTVKLCDFGLASSISTPTSLELMGVYGTPPFMAPDILNGQRYGATVDTWAFGVLMYVLFFGKFPYTPTEPTGPAMKAAILAGTPAPTFRTPPGQQPLTSDALAVAQAVLRREVRDRPTADQALKFAFFTSAEDPNHTYGSLRPMLHAGKRCGAFDLPRGKGGVPKPTEMDTHLFSLRDRIHAKPSQGEDEKPEKTGATPRSGTDGDRR